MRLRKGQSPSETCHARNSLDQPWRVTEHTLSGVRQWHLRPGRCLGLAKIGTVSALKYVPLLRGHMKCEARKANSCRCCPGTFRLEKATSRVSHKSPGHRHDSFQVLSTGVWYRPVFVFLDIVRFLLGQDPFGQRPLFSRVPRSSAPTTPQVSPRPVMTFLFLLTRVSHFPEAFLI